jgi:heavy metal sensor kinase
MALFNSFKHTINNDLNKLLKSKAEDIGQIINSYHQEDRVEAQAVSGKIFDMTNLDLANAVRFAIDNNSSDVFVRVFKPDGSEIAHSNDMSPTIILATAPTNPLTLKEPYFSTSKAVLDKNNSAEFRSFTLPVIEKENVKYVIQVSVTLRHLLSQLARLKNKLFLFLPLFVFLIIVSGLFLTRTVLSPVDNMTKTIRQITSRNLGQRIELTGANDEISRLAETFNDMLTRIDQAFSTQQQLIQDISHELRTPLTALKGKQEVTLNKKRSPEEYEAVLGINLEEINKMSQLVENLLVLAQLEKKEALLKPRPVDLNRVIGQVLNNMQTLADKKNISLLFSPEGKIFLDADENQINRVFLNIIDNAIKYTGDNGKITIKAFKDKDYAEIEISDTGIGIKEEELLYIFDRFYRADKSRSSQGFGLGLSIAKSIVEAHKGAIQVKSELHKGTVFNIFLPIVSV